MMICVRVCEDHLDSSRLTSGNQNKYRGFYDERRHEVVGRCRAPQESSVSAAPRGRRESSVGAAVGAARHESRRLAPRRKGGGRAAGGVSRRLARCAQRAVTRELACGGKGGGARRAPSATTHRADGGDMPLPRLQLSSVPILVLVVLRSRLGVSRARHSRVTRATFSQ